MVEKWQGVDCLIKGMPLILARHPGALLLIVGNGPAKQELIALAEQAGVSDSVIFTGSVPYPEVPLYMNAADICTSLKVELRSGYSPLKLYEYMACGKPVIASRVSGFEVVENSGSGVLVEPNDYQAFAAAIIRLLDDRALRASIGVKARQYVVENHSWDSVARRVAGVFKSVVNKNGCVK
jgi:glycosyltransferase involved in cell wall biosynthesis